MNFSAVSWNTVSFVLRGADFNRAAAEKNYISSSVSVRLITSTMICTPQVEPVGKSLTGCDVAQFLLAIGEFIKHFFLPIIPIFSKTFFVSAEQFQNFFFP